MARVLKALDGRIVLGQKVSILSECGFASTGHGRSFSDKGPSPSGGEQAEAAWEKEATESGESPDPSAHRARPGGDEI